jgi:hypothetical protein
MAIGRTGRIRIVGFREEASRGSRVCEQTIATLDVLQLGTMNLVLAHQGRMKKQRRHQSSEEKVAIQEAASMNWVCGPKCSISGGRSSWKTEPSSHGLRRSPDILLQCFDGLLQNFIASGVITFNRRCDWITWSVLCPVYPDADVPRRSTEHG